MPRRILEVILLKALQFLYNALRLSLHQSIDEVTRDLSIDIVTQDPMLLSADVAAQMRVRVRMGSFGSDKELEETKQLLTMRNEAAMLPSADVTAHRTLSSVCIRWWKLVTRSDRNTRKLPLMIANVADVVCITISTF